MTVIGINAFANCISLSNVILPSNLEIIPTKCFISCSIKSINIPNKVKIIGESSFANNWQLKSVTITDYSDLQKIEAGSFYATIIETIFIPKGVSSLAGAAFETSKTLRTIVGNPSNPYYSIMDGVLYSFNKSVLVKFPANHSTSFEIPNSVTTIEFCAFIDSLIETVKFPPNLQILNGWSFATTRLKSVIIPDSVTFMSNGVFSRCYHLNEITIGSGISAIPVYAFNIANITSITIPENVISVGAHAFEECPYLKDVILPSKISNLGGSCFPTSVNITFPSTAKLSIDDQKILYNLDKTILIMCLDKLTSYVIPSSVETIRAEAFKSMTDLTKIEFRSGSTLKTIESLAFSECIKLSSIEIPNSISYFGESAFSSCTSLKSVFFGSKLTRISTRCFENCVNLEIISFSRCDGSATIDSYSFSGCSHLKTFTLSEGIVSIDMRCFNDCILLESINIPSTLKYIGIYAFSNTKISTVTFASHSSMVNLSQYSFSQCTSLREIVNMPDSIMNIGSNSFESSKISSFTVPISTETIDNYAFRRCSLMETFTIPPRCSLKKIGNFIFEGCVSLSKIECVDSDFFVIDNGALFDKNRSKLICFPPASLIKFFCFSQNVRTISSSAFYGCKRLVGIMIPDDSIESIGHSAFAYCTSLKYINIPICVKSIDQSVFTGCTNLNCGVAVENQNISFKQSLVETSGLSPTSMKDCGLITCKNANTYRPVKNSYLYVFILM